MRRARQLTDAQPVGQKCRSHVGPTARNVCVASVIDDRYQDLKLRHAIRSLVTHGDRARHRRQAALRLTERGLVFYDAGHMQSGTKVQSFLCAGRY